MQNVDEFHGTLKTFTDWLNTAEVAMRGFKYPSKLVDKVTLQIEEHDVRRKITRYITYGVVFVQFYWLNQSRDIHNI
jgi:hypothetical protein